MLVQGEKIQALAQEKNRMQGSVDMVPLAVMFMGGNPYELLEPPAPGEVYLQEGKPQ